MSPTGPSVPILFCFPSRRISCRASAPARLGWADSMADRASEPVNFESSSRLILRRISSFAGSVFLTGDRVRRNDGDGCGSSRSPAPSRALSPATTKTPRCQQARRRTRCLYRSNGECSHGVRSRNKSWGRRRAYAWLKRNFRSGVAARLEMRSALNLLVNGDPRDVLLTRASLVDDVAYRISISGCEIDENYILTRTGEARDRPLTARRAPKKRFICPRTSRLSWRTASSWSGRSINSGSAAEKSRFTSRALPH